MIRRVSLRTRFFIAVIGLLLSAGMILLVYIHTSLQRELFEQIQKRGVAIAQSFERMATNPGLTEDPISLQLLAFDFRNGEEDIEYVYIVGKNGRVTVHTFSGGFPDLLSEVNPLRPGEKHRIRMIRTERGYVYDIAVPILKGELGTAHVGLCADSAREAVSRIIWRVTWLLVALFVVACIGTVFLVRSLTRPIHRLMAGVEAVGQGDLAHRIVADPGDEIGVLADAFNRMAENLQSTTVSRDDVEKLNQRLEALVEERTMQLSQANDELSREIVERRFAEQEILRLNEGLEVRIHERTLQLEASNRELEAFGYSVSHDLSAPLRHIDAFSSMLLEDHRGDLDPEAVHFLERIKAGVVKMKELIEALLKLSRVGRADISREHVDLSSVARQILKHLEEGSPDRRVQVTVEDGVDVFGDRALLGVVMQNLLGNAWKYTSRREMATIEFGRTDIQGETVCFVRDNGIGFAQEHADNLFGVFRRLVSDEEFEGTGIGLATVKRIITRHGGRIWGEGEPGKGATFYFSLN